MQLEIHDQSMTILTIRPKTQKTHHKGGCVEPKFARARNLPQPCWRCWPKTNKLHPKGGCVEPSWHVRRRENLNKTRNHDHRMDKLWENATNQRWHISQILVFPPEFWNIGKCHDRDFPRISSSENLPGIGNTRKMAISSFLVPIFKITSIVPWQILVTNGLTHFYPRPPGPSLRVL